MMMEGFLFTYTARNGNDYTVKAFRIGRYLVIQSVLLKMWTIVHEKTKRNVVNNNDYTYNQALKLAKRFNQTVTESDIETFVKVAQVLDAGDKCDLQLSLAWKRAAERVKQTDYQEIYLHG